MCSDSMASGFVGGTCSNTSCFQLAERRGSPNIFEITERVEMGQMASMFFNKGK